MNIKPLFDNLEQFGEHRHAYIVGAGWEGSNAFNKIPDDAFTIAVNCAIRVSDADYVDRMNRLLNLDIKPRAWSVWGAFDQQCHKAAFWPPPLQPETKAVLGSIVSRYADFDHYMFDHCGVIRDKKNPLIKNGLLGGATITGCMIQLAYRLGADHITLVAVDMQGDRHWDNTPASKRPGTWPQSRRLQHLIKWLSTNRGIHFDTLSKTALRIPDAKV